MEEWSGLVLFGRTLLILLYVCSRYPDDLLLSLASFWRDLDLFGFCVLCDVIPDAICVVFVLLFVFVPVTFTLLLTVDTVKSLYRFVLLLSIRPKTPTVK